MRIRVGDFTDNRRTISAADKIAIHVGVGDEREVFTVDKNVLRKQTKFFDAALGTETGKKGILFLNDGDPAVVKLVTEWFSTVSYIPSSCLNTLILEIQGDLPFPPTKFTLTKLPGKAELQRQEDNLRKRFDAMQYKLVQVYCLAEKWALYNLMNNAIDTIQHGFLDYGTVFGPRLLMEIFEGTKPGSQLRELCIATNVIHMDRGCGQLRSELQMASLTIPEFFPTMLTWISRNFHLMGRRHAEGYDVRKQYEGFSVLNRNCLCECHFHTHEPGQAHKGHKKCAVPYLKCGHEDSAAANVGAGPTMTVDLTQMLMAMGMGRE